VIEVGREKILCGCCYRTGDSDLNYCKNIIDSIDSAQKLIDNKSFTGLLIGGDFNFPTIKWNEDNTGFNTSVKYEPANLFLDCLHENFLFQNVNKNTFQNNVDETTNILDYILTESQNRILALNHLPPLGNIDHGHHVLVFDYTYLNDTKKTKLINSKMLYNKGKFSDLNLFFTNIDWDIELVGPNIDEVYNKFLTFYNEGCNKFIPTKKFHE
jgi:hypothetical protein